MAEQNRYRETWGDRHDGDPGIERNRQVENCPRKDYRFVKDEFVETIDAPTRRDWERGDRIIKDRG